MTSIMDAMYYYEVAPNRIIRQDAFAFTYASETQLQVGQIVLVEIGKKNHAGVVLRKTSEPPYKTKMISEIIEQVPLPSGIMQLIEWISTYYGSHLATVLQTTLPTGLTKKRRDRTKGRIESIRNRTNYVLNPLQTEAIRKVSSASPGTLLLHGVTGSGKTAIYTESIRQVLDAGKSAILLVPEIALTSQLVDELSHHFENVILAHSKQTEAERHHAWREALNATEPRVIIGPRSALFLPIKNLELIIIDEAHEPSFKQEKTPRYSALRAASILAASNHAKVILGSATPLISDYYLAKFKKDSLIEVPERAVKNASAPEVDIVDMTKKSEFSRHRFLSEKLLAAIDFAFDHQGQALIFHNRRGSASTTLCENCGWSASCPHCFLPLTLHTDSHLLRCHTCGYKERVPTSCPVCSAAEIIHKGIGTKLIESELQKLFPTKSIARFDGDTDTGDTVESRYKDIYSGKIDIIIGTQVIAKGLDLPSLRTVGVIQADAGLALPDYTSPERTFQLLAQVVGRVGRSNQTTKVVVQSYQPNHYAVTTGISQDYQTFYTTAIAERQRASFPPFSYILKLTCSYKSEAAAIRQSMSLAKTLKRHASPTVKILGPTPAFYERLRDQYRWQLLVKSTKRSDLIALLDHLPPTHWQFELDPTSLL